MSAYFAVPESIPVEVVLEFGHKFLMGMSHLSEEFGNKHEGTPFASLTVNDEDIVNHMKHMEELGRMPPEAAAFYLEELSQKKNNFLGHHLGNDWRYGARLYSDIHYIEIESVDLKTIPKHVISYAESVWESMPEDEKGNFEHFLAATYLGFTDALKNKVEAIKKIMAHRSLMDSSDSYFSAPFNLPSSVGMRSEVVKSLKFKKEALFLNYSLLFSDCVLHVCCQGDKINAFWGIDVLSPRGTTAKIYGDKVQDKDDWFDSTAITCNAVLSSFISAGIALMAECGTVQSPVGIDGVVIYELTLKEGINPFYVPEATDYIATVVSQSSKTDSDEK